MNTIEDAGHFVTQAHQLCADLGIELSRTERRPSSWFVVFRRYRDARAFVRAIEPARIDEGWDWRYRLSRRWWSTVPSAVDVPHRDLRGLVACLRSERQVRQRAGGEVTT